MGVRAPVPARRRRHRARDRSSATISTRTSSASTSASTIAGNPDSCCRAPPPTSAIVRRFVGFGAVFFVLISIQVIAIFSVLLTLHVGLALLTFVAAIPVVMLCRRFERDYHVIVRDIQDQTGDLTTTIEEARTRHPRAQGVRSRPGGVRRLRRAVPPASTTRRSSASSCTPSSSGCSASSRTSRSRRCCSPASSPSGAAA